MKKILKIMYHGERVNMIGKIYQLFKDKNGKEYHYCGIKDLWFGRVYSSVDGRMNIRPEEISPTPWEPSGQESLEYEAQKLSVREQRTRPEET